MLFGNHGQALLLHERHSRRILSSLPPELCRSVTFDNGTEIARRYRRHTLGIRTYFCDVRSQWQKVGIENAIGRRNPGVPQYAPAVPGLPDARRSIRRRVALEMRIHRFGMTGNMTTRHRDGQSDGRPCRRVACRTPSPNL